jgi:hypothetical protein
MPVSSVIRSGLALPSATGPSEARLASDHIIAVQLEHRTVVKQQHAERRPLAAWHERLLVHRDPQIAQNNASGSSK